MVKWQHRQYQNSCTTKKTCTYMYQSEAYTGLEKRRLKQSMYVQSSSLIKLYNQNPFTEKDKLYNNKYMTI